MIAQEGNMGSNYFKAGILLALFAVFTCIPFLSQAFHMDDGIYVLLAENIKQNFWFPQDKPIFFEGLYVGDISSTEHAWPLTSYLMALCASAGDGFSEIALHSGFLIFPIVLAISMHRLASQFTAHPVHASLVLLTLPVVSVLSHTLMTDIPLLALWVASTVLVCRGVDTGKKSCLWIGSATAALCSLISYSGLCLVMVLGLYAILRKKQGALFPILILPVSVLGIILVIHSFHYHRFPLNMLLGYYFIDQKVLSPALLVEKLMSAVLTIGAVTIFPLTLLILCKRKIIAAALVIGIGLVLLTPVSKYSFAQRILFLVIFCIGLPPIIDAAGFLLKALRRRACGDPEEFFLSAWFIGMLVFCVAAYMNGSARYLLPAIPPFVLILIRRMERSLNPGAFRWIGAATIVFGGAFGMLLSVADYQFAGIYRDFAATLKKESSNHDAGIWFAGEWGFRTYLEREGGRELGRRDSSPKPHDLLVVPTLAIPYQTLFSEDLSLDSIAMVSPSRVTFEIPPALPDSVLTCTIGMPFYDKSDGAKFSVRFVSPGSELILSESRILPSEGKQWRTIEIPLKEIAGNRGSIQFRAEVGSSNNADADWIAIARARISQKNVPANGLLYDFREHLKCAHIWTSPGVQYHTKQNAPVFPMTVWLKQEPAIALLERHEYRPGLQLRVLDGSCHAGFWSSGWGLLPFSFATDKAALESIHVYEITRRIDAYGESAPHWYEPSK
jgi:hypothetical protein